MRTLTVRMPLIVALALAITMATTAKSHWSLIAVSVHLTTTAAAVAPATPLVGLTDGELGNDSRRRSLPFGTWQRRANQRSPYRTFVDSWSGLVDRRRLARRHCRRRQRWVAVSRERLLGRLRQRVDLGGERFEGSSGRCGMRFVA